MPSILIVDDDHEIRALLQRFFEKHDYEVGLAESANAMDARLAQRRYDLVILDVMLPGEDGLSLCRRLRATSNVSIIMVTGVTEATDKVVGLEMGADDYVTKPFDARELLARVRSVLRRRADAPGPAVENDRPVLCFDQWALDLTRRELRAADTTLIPLSGGEFDLLVVLAEHPQRVLSRDQLIDLARGPAHEAFDRSIDVQISRLRRKIEVDASDPQIIRTIRNGGYMFTAEVARR